MTPAARSASDDRPTSRGKLFLEWALGLVSLGLGLVFILPSWGYPFGGDQANHWYVGRGMLLGFWPYTDAGGLSEKPPVPFLLHAIAEICFGHGQHAIRILDSLLLAAVAVAQATLALGGRAGKRKCASFTATSLLVSAALYYGLFDYSDVGHPELWGAECLVVAFATLGASGEVRTRRVVLGGLLLGLAVLCKFSLALPAAVVGAFLVRRVWPLPERWRLLGGAASAAAVLPVLFVLAYAVTGRFPLLKESLWEALRYYVARAPSPGDPSVAWLARSTSALIGVGLCAFGAGVFGWWTERSSASATAASPVALHAWRDWEEIGWTLGVLGAAAASVGWQGRASSIVFDYHWSVLSPFLTTLVLLVASRGEKWLEERFACMGIAVGVSVLACAPEWAHSKGLDTWQHARLTLDVALGRRPSRDLQAKYRGISRLDPVSRMESVAELVNAMKQPSSTLCVEGFATPIYVLTELRCPSRFFCHECMLQKLPRWRTEYAETLRRVPPELIVTFSDRRTRLAELEAAGYVATPEPTSATPRFVVLRRVPDGH